MRMLVHGLCIGWMCLLLILVLQGCRPTATAPAGAGAASAGGGAGADPATGTDAPAGTDATAEADKPAATKRTPRPAFDGWEKPAVALVLSGEEHGYLEPCGCSETQSGGFSRRDDLFKQRRDAGWTTVALGLGGTISQYHSRPQDKIKFETILTGLKDMHYSGLALGREELRLGAELLIALHQPEELPFLDANVVLLGAPDIGTPLSTKVVEAGGMKIGVTAIIGSGYKSDVLPAGAQTEIEIKEPAEVLPKAIADLEAQKPDLLLLLSHAPLAESKKLAEKFPQFDVILSAGGPEDPAGAPEEIGKTRLITVGAKGKHVGVVGVYPGEKGPTLKYELVDLDNVRFGDSPKMHELMRFYQDRLRDEHIVEKEKPIPHPSGATYVGAEVCGECHKKAHEKWITTGHSHAYETLEKGRKGAVDWIPRIHDPECLACHVTGWNPKDVYPYTSGFVTAEKTPLLKGQQCENCHGPGSAHVEDGKSMKLDKKIAIDRMCYDCHDSDNSPKFKFEEYWKLVEHPGRD